MERPFGQKSIFIFMMTGRDFIMINQDFHDGRSWFYYEWLEFSWWQVEILLWTVAIFLVTGRTGWDFFNDRSKFSLWQIEIFFNHNYNRGCLVLMFHPVVNFLARLNTMFFFHFVFKTTSSKMRNLSSKLLFYY